MCEFLVCSNGDCDHSSRLFLSFASQPAGVSPRRVEGGGCGDTVAGDGDGGGDTVGNCGAAGKSDKDNSDGESGGGGGDDDTVTGGDGDGDGVSGGSGEDGEAKSNGDNKRLTTLEVSVTGDCRIENRGDTDEGEVVEEM